MEMLWLLGILGGHCFFYGLSVVQLADFKTRECLPSLSAKRTLHPSCSSIYVGLFVALCDFYHASLFLKEPALTKLGKEIIVGTCLSGIVFLLFPSVLGFERVIPNEAYRNLFENIFALDLPHNMAPSLHIVYSGAILLAIFQSSEKKGIKAFAMLWLLFISLSTLLVHQHHLIDIFLGYILVILLNNTIQTKGESLE